MSLKLNEIRSPSLQSTSPSRSITIEPSNISFLRMLPRFTLHLKRLTSHAVIPSVVFWQDTVFVGEPASFQLTLTPLPGALLSLVFSSMHLYWDEHEPPLILEHSEDKNPSDSVQLGNVNRLVPGSTDQNIPRAPVEAALQWHAGNAKVFSGSITSYSPIDLQVSEPPVLTGEVTCDSPYF